MSNQPSDHRKLRPSKPAARERAVAPAGLKHIADKYSIIFDTTSDGIWIHNLDGQILEVNDAYCRMSGYTRDELLKLRIPDIEAVEKPEDVARHIRRVAETGFDRFESKHRKKNGEVFDVEISASYWRATGQFLLFARDISRRKRGEAELAQHRDHLDEMVKQRTTLLERMNTRLEDEIAERKRMEREIESMARFPSENPYPVLRLSRDGTILYANPPAQALLGGQGSASGEAAPAFLRAMAREAFDRRAATRVDIELDEKWWSFVVTPVVDAGYANFYGRDITDRKRAEEALRESEEKFKLIATHMPDHILVQDKDLRYTWVLNPQLGLTLDDMIGKTDFEFLPKEDAANLTTIKRRVLDTGNPEYVTAPLASREGGTEYFEGSYVPTHDPEGLISGLIGYFRNVTERVKTEEELRLQASALQAAANGIVITDHEGTIRWVNQAFERLTGYSAAEAVGNNPRILKSGHHDEAYYRTLWETILSGRVWHGEIVNKRKDGRLYHEEMTITPVLDADGAAANFIAIKQDITERKQAEEALRQANERIEKLLGANVIGIAEFDATKIVSANRALLDMTGYSERDVARGRIDWREITPPEYAERDNRAWREMMEHGECLPYEKEYITRDGKRIPILIAGVRLTADPVTGVFLNLDITDWKLMEMELLETTHYAEHLFESSLIGLTRSNTEGLLDANDAFLDMVGYTRADLEAGLIDIQAMTPPEYAALDERGMTEMLATGEATPYEKEYVRKDGSRVPVLVGRKLIKESPPEWVAFVLDLTERKRAEADLERVRTEFLGEISHELKTPLTAIKGCASMALSSATPPDSAEARELFEVVDAQANRLTDLVGNLLDMTRIEGGRLSIDPDEIDLAKIVDEAKVIFEHSRYPHSLQVKLPPKLPRVRADGRRIVQVLANLYSNAAKFSSPQTPIVVSAEHRGSEVVVHVRDRGAGIPGDKMPLLFQKFVQIHTIGAKGTGLGLFICKGIVEAQGGRIWAESAGEGQGSTFTFALPAVAARRTAATKGAKTGTGKPAPGVGGRGQRRVVAIDDEPHILRYLEHCLRTANYEVAMTTDPFAAPALVKSQDPDIVLLDMRLPGTSGLRVLEEIRKFSSVPVAFITATANREDVERGRQFGGTTWLEKPFSREQLLDHVHGILAQHRRRKR
jgi:PAS domain S-box-containing protein